MRNPFLPSFYFFIFLIKLFGFCISQDSVIDAYENLILSEKKKSETYQLPTDGRIYEPDDPNVIIDYGTVDFIVVGSGSTGSVVAGRLSERKDWNVLLLEAGDFGNNLTEITRMAYTVTAMSDYNWGYYSIPQTTACLGLVDNRCAHPRGRGVGGTAILNAVIYLRGNRKDFDTWCSMGNPGWCYTDVLPFFLKSEDFHKTYPDAVVDEEFHATGGLLRVNHPMPINPQTKVFIQANEEMGYNLTDMNGRQQIGVMPFQISTDNGTRVNSATAFLHPFLNRQNLKVLTKSLVTKIIINDQKEAQGIIFTQNGKQYRAMVKKEVLVCGGAINSPQLLMLSGIGPKKHLEEIGIPVIQDLEVGSSFSDHIQVYGLTFSSNLSEPVQTLREQIKDYLNGVGTLASALPSQAVAYYATSLASDPDYPDLEISFADSNATNDALTAVQRWKPEVSNTFAGVNASSSFSMFVTPLHTRSVGTVRLNSSSPYDYPVLDPNVLSDPEGKDMQIVYEGIQYALRLIEMPAFKAINAKFEQKPLEVCNMHKFLTKDYWYCAMRYISAHNNHPVSSCKMGPDPKSGHVVDANLKVHGIKNLRVADASVVPLSTSSHVNAICYMMGEKLADLLKTDYPEFY